MLKRLRKGKVLHSVTIHDNRVFTAGLAAADLDQGMGGQTRQILALAEELLTEAGSGKDLLLVAQIFVTDLSVKPEMDAAWLEWLDGDDLPCRATIGVSDLGHPRRMIEILFTAALRETA